MSSISKKIKNIFKNKIVLYSVIAVTVIAIGIVVWGAVTDWKFWNVHKKSSSPPIPDYPIKHNCHPQFCKKCDIYGERCKECIEGTENISGYCFKPPTHQCSETKCTECSKDGKKCKTCDSGYVLDKNGYCCSGHEKINGVCCDKPCDEKCCPKGKICMKSLNKTKKGCCSPGQSLDNGGKCCFKRDDFGNCCDNKNETLCGDKDNQYCCGNTGENGENTCENNICELNCGTGTCKADENCGYLNEKEQCIDKTCIWGNDQTTYYPQLTYSIPNECNKNSDCGYNGVCVNNSGKKGWCQYYPIGVVPKTEKPVDVLKKNVLFEEDGLGNPYLFLFTSNDLNKDKYRFSKVKSNSSKTKKQSFKCTVADCREKLGDAPASETVYFNNKTGECLVEEQTGKEIITPSSNNICPFKDETGDNSKRCCLKDNGNWSGQVCDKGNECVYDKNKSIGTCLPYNRYTDQNGNICGENNVEKGLKKINHKTGENGKNIGYCDCGSKNKHLNDLKCTIPSECNQDGNVCSGNGRCLQGKASSNGKPTYSCTCDPYYKGDKCESVDTDKCRAEQKRGFVPWYLISHDGPIVGGIRDYGDIKTVRKGQTCSDVISACQSDCRKEMTEWCPSENFVKACSKKENKR